MVRAISQERTITAEVTGTDRYKYFRRPVTEAKDGAPSEVTSRFPLLGFDNIASLGLLAPPTTAQKPPTRCAATQIRATQTDYRESEAQTVPWTPPYTTRGASTPEVLYLDQLSWGKGLPPGRHEVEIVDRLRRKRAWESRLPPLDCPDNINIRFKLIAEMEKSDWQFREKEIEAVHEERMKKSEQLLEEHNLMNRSRLSCRLEYLEEDINRRKEHKLQLIRHEKERALRKLCMKEKGYDPRKNKMSVLDEHFRLTSELNPSKRYGVNLRDRHKEINIDGDVCDLAYTPTSRPVFDFHKASQPKKQTELCVRETRWTMDNLVKLHQDLQKLRARSSKAETFFAQVEHRPKSSARPETQHLPSSQPPMTDESLYQAAILIQRVVHSRSMQALMQHKRHFWKELMQEIKTPGACEPERTESADKHILQTRLAGVLDNLIGLNVGTSIGQTLYLLATELLRFKNEGVAHSQALQAEAARWRRELPEEGRRQREMRRREEHNLMFTQLLEVYQESINDFLTGLVTQAREDEAKLQAYEHGKEVARLAELDRLRLLEPVPETPVSADLLFQLIAPEGLRDLTHTCLLILKQKYQEARDTLVSLGQADPLPEDNSRTPLQESRESVMEQRDKSGIEGVLSEIVVDQLKEMEGSREYLEEVQESTSSGITVMEQTSDGLSEVPNLECRKFGLQGASESGSAEERLVARVMRDMCYVAGSLLHTAAKILNRAVHLAGIPQESFNEALRRTTLVINGALQQVISLILPKKPEEKEQPVSEELIREASKIVDAILQKAKHRISEMKDGEGQKMAANDAENEAKVLVEDVINEAQQKVLRIVVEDFLADLIQEAKIKVQIVNES
ncbi:cilia- and flagella-associated protein 91-like isoform X2 [Macrosteles quadrilineatus]|uniref:cilia- and flagella-associated protein 91-like isoform X2 n=1 Tax=Macrosteles quadrilineatus TaxID=74068 RepID=UPI0023E091E6|nr:cilia- and flagella-associated protein 91-like isoform X2 [Macrosteles quadrilineatus]